MRWPEDILRRKVMSDKNLLKEGTIRRFMKLAGTDILATDFLTEETKGHGPGKEVKPGANVVPAGSRWLKEQEEEEELDIDVEAGGEELDMAMGDEDLGLDLDAPELEDDDVEGETSVEDFARDVLDAIKDVAEDHGVEMEVEEMPEPEEIDVGEMEVEDEGEGLELGGEETGELGGEVEEEEEEELMEFLSAAKKTLKKATCKKEGGTWNKETNKCDKAYGGNKGDESRSRRDYQEEGKLAEVNYIDEDLLMKKVYKRVADRILNEKKADDRASVLAERITQRLRKR